MMTIRQTVDIPADRRLHLELPKSVPTGNTEVHITFLTVPAKVKSMDEALERLLQPQTTLEEFKREAAAKTAKRIASGREPFEEARKLLNGRRLFDGIDGVEYQRSLRDEWPD
jgi:predicted metal-dependent phosphoesterase TrpH